MMTDKVEFDESERDEFNANNSQKWPVLNSDMIFQTTVQFDELS